MSDVKTAAKRWRHSQTMTAGEDFCSNLAFIAGAAWQRAHDAHIVETLECHKLINGKDVRACCAALHHASVAIREQSKQANSDPHASDGGCERSKDDIPASSVRAFINQDFEAKATAMVPQGCTCPNNGCRDCPWCVAVRIEKADPQ